MKTLSGEEQIAMLRPSLAFAAQMHLWFLTGAVLGVIIAVVLWHPVPLMVAIFLGLIGLSENKAGPNLVAAIEAYDSSMPSYGEVTILVTSDSDSDRYHAVIREEEQPDWKYQFIPQRWQPREGTYSARIWRAGNERKPILAIIDEGIMIPRHDPELVYE